MTPTFPDELKGWAGDLMASTLEVAVAAAALIGEPDETPEYDKGICDLLLTLSGLPPDDYYRGATMRLLRTIRADVKDQLGQKK